MPYIPDQKLPIDEDEVRARHESNRANWNEGAVAYTQDIDSTVDFIWAGKSNMALVERANLGDPVEKQSPRFEKGWNLMEIINALIDAGLTIEYLGEHPEAE